MDGRGQRKTAMSECVNKSDLGEDESKFSLLSDIAQDKGLQILLCPDSNVGDATNSKPDNGTISEEDEDDGDTLTSLSGQKLSKHFRRAVSLTEQQQQQEKEDPVIDHCIVDDVFVPPDGGYGWFVALGAFIAMFWSAGLIKTYGVIFAEVLRLFPHSSKSLASWIPAGMTSVALMMAPVASALCQRWNCRRVTLIGSFLCALGISLSSVATNMETLFVTLGVLTGMGVGLSNTPGVILTARYFDKNRAKANALCLSGSAAGSFVLPHLIHLLVVEYGFKGTLLILGGCMLHLCISAALYRPLAVHVAIVKKQEAAAARRKQSEVPPPSINPTIVVDHWPEEDASLAMLDSSSEGLSDKGLKLELPVQLARSVSHDKPKRGSIFRAPTWIAHDKATGEKQQPRRRLSFVWSLEDLNTDSTCVWKDTRHTAAAAATTLENEHFGHRRRIIRYERSISERGPGDTHDVVVVPLQKQIQHMDRRHSEKPPLFNRSKSFTSLFPTRKRKSSCYLDAYHAEHPEGPGDNSMIVVATPPTTEPRKKTNCCALYFDLSVVKEPTFLVMAVTVMAMTFGVPHVLYFLPAHSMQVLDMDASTLLSVSAVADLLGRLTTGIIVDLRLIPLHSAYAFATLLSGLAVLLIPLVHDSMVGLVAATLLYGFGAGSWFLLVPVSLSEYLGVKRIAASYGMVRFFQSGANLFGPILGGELWELSGNLDATFYFIGAVMTSAFFVALLQPWAIRRAAKKESKKNLVVPS